ncbi:MAG: peptidylprolyl isomerase [Pseudomonadota bacterium]
MAHRSLLALALSLAMFTACKKEPAPVEPSAESQPAGVAVADDAPAYKINGEVITEHSVQQAMEALARSVGAAPAMLPPEIQQRLRERAEEHVVSRALLKQHSVASGVEITDADVDARFAEFMSHGPAGKSEAELLAMLGVDKDTLRRELKLDLQIEKVVDKVKAEAAPSAEAIQKHYDDNKARFTKGDQASASHVLLRLTPDAGAEEVERVRKEAVAVAEVARKGDQAAFAKMADEKSQDPSAKTNHGDMGFFDRGMMVPEFEALAFTLKEGQVSDPVRTSFGWHVLRGQGVRKAGTRSLDEVKGEIVDELAGQAVAEKMDALVKELRGKATIERLSKVPEAPKVPAMPGMMQLPAPAPAPAGEPPAAPAPAPAP